MKKKTDMPINHRRFIWLSNAAWLSSEYARIKAVEAKKVADEAAKILKKEGVAKRKREAAELAAAMPTPTSGTSHSMLKHGILSAIGQQRAKTSTLRSMLVRFRQQRDNLRLHAAFQGAAYLKSKEHTEWLARICPLEC